MRGTENGTVSAIGGGSGAAAGGVATAAASGAGVTAAAAAPSALIGKTARQTEQRARRPPTGTLAGSTRKIV
jgi:hypothetical protein